MAALANNIMQARAWRGLPLKIVSCAQIAAEKRCYAGGVAMSVDDDARPVLSGSDMAGVVTLMAGSDANGGVYISARQPLVKVEFLGGTDKSLSVDVTSSSGFRTVSVQLATSGTTVTTTGEGAADAIRAHAGASKLLRAKAQGTGASATAATAAAFVKCVKLLGVPDEEIDNSTAGSSAADLTLRNRSFKQGWYKMSGKSGDVPTLDGTICGLSNDNEIMKTTDFLDLTAPLFVDGNGDLFVNLAEAE